MEALEKTHKKSLAIIFSTLVLGTGVEARDRLKEYAACYKQLIRIIPNSFDLIFVDNSIDSLDVIDNPDLRSILSGQKLILTHINHGAFNKGVGELSMLCDVTQKVDLLTYENVCYCTGRKFFTCPYAFEKAESTKCEAVVSDADYMFLDGTLLVSNKNMYNDMFFSMKSHIMKEFVKQTQTQLSFMEKNMVNSETNLYNFIHSNTIDYELLPFLGLIRSDRHAMPEKSLYHIC